MEQPPIYIFDIKIQEPVTSLTDLIVGVACIWCFFLLKKQNRPEKPFVYFRLFFILMGIATILAGILGHAFFYAAGMWLKAPGWIISMISIMCIERGCIEHATPLIKPRIVSVFKVVNIIELLTFMFLAFYFLEFKYVQAHSTYGLVVVVFAFELYVYRKTRMESIKYILYAVASMVVCATVYLTKLSIHPYFNHADLAHMFMLLSAILAYKGISRLELIDKKHIRKAQYEAVQSS